MKAARKAHSASVASTAIVTAFTTINTSKKKRNHLKGVTGSQEGDREISQMSGPPVGEMFGQGVSNKVARAGVASMKDYDASGAITSR